MARAKASVVPTTTTAPVPQLPVMPLPVREPAKTCGNCMHWRPRMYTTYFGECGRSQGSGPSALVTTDLQSCSGHDAKR